MDQEDLLKRLKSDEVTIRNQAYEDLYELAYDICASYVFKNGGDDTDAGDCFRDALIVLLQTIRKNPSFKLTSKIQTFLYGITRNVWLNRLREKRKNLEQASEEDSLEILHADDSAFFVDYENPRAENELGEKVFRAMQIFQNLKHEDCKRVLSLFYFEKRSMAEIAEIMGIKTSFARNKKYRCIQRLKEEVNQKMQSQKS